MALTYTATAQITADMAVIGRRVLAVFEGCECQGCRLLDMRMDTDLAAANGNQFEWVSYRNQRGTYEYRTLTIRWQSDRGNSRVQGHKILEGQTLADIYVQAYTGWVVWAERDAVKQSVRQTHWGCTHNPMSRGSGGQQFVVLCDNCCALHVVDRPSQVAA